MTLDDIDAELVNLNAEIDHLTNQYGALMNSIAEAMKVATKRAPRKLMRVTVTKGKYKHTVVYNHNDPTERAAVGARITECLENGFEVNTKEYNA